MHEQKKHRENRPQTKNVKIVFSFSQFQFQTNSDNNLLLPFDTKQSGLQTSYGLAQKLVAAMHTTYKSHKHIFHRTKAVKCDHDFS